MRRRLALLGLASLPAAACDSLPFLQKPKRKKKKKTAEENEAAASPTEATETAAEPSSTSKGPIVVHDMPEKPARTDPGMFGKAKEIVKAIEAELGSGARVLSVSIFYDYAVIYSRDPNEPRGKRHFTYRGGALREQRQPSFVPADPKGLERDEFPLAEVAWSDLPKINADALARLKGSWGDINYLSVHRPVLAKNVEVRYYCKRGVDNVMIAYSAKGKFIELHG